MLQNMVLCANLSAIPEFNDLVFNANSSKGLKLNKVECKTSNPEGYKYKVITYDKSILSYDNILSFGLCRSIVVNEDNHVVCFAPQKSTASDIFIKKYPVINENIVTEEFVEGTMVNVFWDPKIGLSGAWEITTRNTVGAVSSFYKSSNTKTFRTMFIEATKECNIILERLNKKFCYSFVLQHPENRIVVPFSKPALYLVGLYHITNEPNNIKVYNYNLSLISNELLSYIGLDDTGIRFPEKYNCNNYTELINKYASMNTSYNILGLHIYNILTGERTKIRNPVYEEVRQLRGNQPKLQYQYLCLRKEGKVKDYLQYYPENKHDFSQFRDQVHLFTNTLHNNYISCYIKKEQPLLNYSEQYRTHMYNIHQLFINDLREKKMRVTNTVVIKYVNELHPSLLMYCLNHNMRKRNVDFIRADANLEQ